MIFQVINNWCLASGAVKARTSILGLLEGGNYRSRVAKPSFIPLSNNHRWIVKNSSECCNSTIISTLLDFKPIWLQVGLHKLRNYVIINNQSPLLLPAQGSLKILSNTCVK